MSDQTHTHADEPSFAGAMEQQGGGGDDANHERLYTPAPDEAQLTPRAVLTGCCLGAVVSAMNIYFGLRTGWSIGGSLIAAILGFSVWVFFKNLFGARAYTPLETNITQTSGSAAGSMTSTAGLLAAIPALYLLHNESNGDVGAKLSYGELTLWALAVAYLGVFFAVPLRNQMVVVEKLRFPTGTATAETIVSMFAEGAQAIAQARMLVFTGIAAALFTLGVYFIPPLGHPTITWGFFGIAAAWGFSLLISPLMTGAGILIGPRVGTSLLLGAIASWGIIGPYVASQGWCSDDPAHIMSYQQGPRGWILWPGVAIMVADALTNLALSWKTIIRTFKPGAAADTGMESEDERIPNSWWLIGLGLGTTATVTVAWFVFAIPPWMTIIAVAMSSVLAMIAVRSTGETDINPIGGMGKVTQLVFGGIGQAQIKGMEVTQQMNDQLMTSNLMGAAITGAGASQAGDMMQDLKTGRLLGATPRKQIIAQCIGITAGILVAVPIYKLFEAAGEKDPSKMIGGTDVPAPAAHAWKAMAEVLSKGFDELPTNATWAILIGAIFGMMVPIIRKSFKPAAKWMPSGLAFGIAFIVPAYYSVAMFLGSMLLVIWGLGWPKSCKIFAIAVASGLIAGEGLMGVGTAVLTLLGVQPLM